jgi:hypothetical protein
MFIVSAEIYELKQARIIIRKQLRTPAATAAPTTTPPPTTTTTTTTTTIIIIDTV